MDFALLYTRQSASGPKPFLERDPVPLAAAAVCLSLAWSSFILRVWRRTKVIRAFGWDDAAISFSLIFFTAYAIAVIYICDILGGGTVEINLQVLRQSVEKRTSARADFIRRWLIVSEVFYILTIMMLKISLGILMLRIVVAPWQRRVIQRTIIFSTLVSVVLLFYAIFQCGVTDTTVGWIIKQLENKCLPQKAGLFMSYLHAAVTTTTDPVFVLLPTFVLSRLNMARRAKITVACLIILGGIGCVCSIVRFPYIEALTLHSNDCFYDGRSLSIWSTAEPGIGKP